MHHIFHNQSFQQNLHQLNHQTYQDQSPALFYSSSELDIIFDRARLNLHQFINSLGNLKDLPLNLSSYKLLNEDQSITSYSPTITTILQIYDNIIRKIKNHKKKRINWSIGDTTLLVWILQKYKASRKIPIEQFTEANWNFIANMIPCKTSEQCMFKYLKLQKKNQTRDWTQAQDQILKQLVEQNQNRCWNKISEKIYSRNPGIKIFRTSKKCRERWECYVKPNLRKVLWTPEEDFNLLKHSFQIGKKWAQISKLLSGRTENAVKNRYHYLASKFKKYRKMFQSEELFLTHYMNELEVNLMMNIEKFDPMQSYQQKIKKSKTSKNRIRKRISKISNNNIIQNQQQELNSQIQQQRILQPKQQQKSKHQQSPHENQSIFYYHDIMTQMDPFLILNFDNYPNNFSIIQDWHSNQLYDDF